ncbi:hypothetical protein [Vibrio sp. PNB22_4_2]
MSNNKPHVVLVVGSYIPKPSAVGVCAEKVVNQFSDKYRVTVLALKNENELNDKDVHDNYVIHRVSTRYTRKINSLKNKSDKYHKAKHLFFRLGRLRRLLTSKVTLDNDLIEAYQEELLKINARKKIDVVIPLCFPFESIESALKFKETVNDKVKVLPYIFDNFSNSASLHRFYWNRKLKFKNNLSLERKMFFNSEHVFAMHPLKDHFDKFIGGSIDNRISYLEHPLLDSNMLNDITSNNSLFKLNYSGGLFRKVREPRYMLDLLRCLGKDINIECDFYTFGTACEDVKIFCDENNFAKYHGQVSREELKNAYSETDVLINLGEIEGKQISSKIFEYMSLGKPIIHVSYVSDCIVSKVLSDYPLVQIVDVNEDITESYRKIVTFVLERGKKRLSFSEVSNLYPQALPEFTANMMSKYFDCDAD